MKRATSSLRMVSGWAAAIVLAAGSIAHATFADMESFSSPPSTSGWASSSAAETNPGADGNGYLTDGGYLRLTTGPADDRIHLELPAVYGGDWEAKFGATGNIQWDVKTFPTYSSILAGNAGGTFGSYFNLYQPSYAGWRYPLPGVGPAANVVHVSIPFDANWTDVQASAAGWIASEYGGATWASTVANVGTQVQGSGMFIAASNAGLDIGIDHFVPGPSQIPEPSSAILLLSLGGGLLGGRSRRRA